MVEEILDESGKDANQPAGKRFSGNGNGRPKDAMPNGKMLEDLALGEESPYDEVVEAGSITGSIREARKQLLDKLEKGKYTSPMYYKELTGKVSKKTANSQAPSEQALLAKLNSEDLPLSYDLIDFNLRRLTELDAEADEFRNPLQKPDTSKLNYLRDYKAVISQYCGYTGAKIRKAMKGKHRTHDTVLEEMVKTIDQTHTHVVTALAHSARITDGLTAYQETIIEGRIQNAATEWGKASNADRTANALLKLVSQYKEGSAPAEYAQFSIAERNLARLRQHSTAKMGANEALAVHNHRTMAAVNDLETNIRTGALELEKFSVLIAQTLEDVQYTTQGTLLLRHGYKSVEALAQSALTLRNIMSLRIKQIGSAVGQFNQKLEMAQANITAEEEEAQAAEQPRIAAVGYERSREEALRLFAQRGVPEAKRALYNMSSARQ